MLFCFSTWKTKSWQVWRLFMWHSTNNIWEYAPAHQQHPSGNNLCLIFTVYSNVIKHNSHLAESFFESTCALSVRKYTELVWMYCFDKCAMCPGSNVPCTYCRIFQLLIIIVCWPCSVMQTSLIQAFSFILFFLVSLALLKW